MGPQEVEVTCHLAPNPSPMTLDGTNTYVVTGPSSIVVIDPGPEHVEHARRVVETVLRAGGDLHAGSGESPVADIVLTHHHPDHVEGLPLLLTLLAEAGVPGRALASDPHLVRGAQPLAEGDVVGGLAVLHTPGHTSDSLCLLSDDGTLFTGDTVLGRGTTVIDYPNGRLGAYLESLARLEILVGKGVVRRMLPGHGESIADPAAVLRQYVAHRAERLEQVRAGLADAGLDARDVLNDGAGLEALAADVYAPLTRDENPYIWGAALKSLEAQVEYLALGTART